MNIPDIINKTGCLVFLLVVLCFLLWAAPHEDMNDSSAAKAVSTTQKPTQLNTAEAKDEQSQHDENTPAANATAETKSRTRTQQSPAVEEALAPSEKSEEWDWPMCPAVFGCPCPLTP